MLTEKTHKPNDTVTVSLINGQELIGRYIKEDMYNITIKKPLTLAIGPQGAAFQPFTMTGNSDSEVSIRLSSVVSVLSARGEISTAYGAATSGLVVPETSGLIL
jgi:hypothetical protein